MVKHGRRAKALSEDQDAVPTDQVFRLQLKPNVGADFKPHIQTVTKEYGTRYLEQLGIKPAKSTLDLVQKNVPLTEQCIATTLRAKGHVNDELQLTVPSVAHTFRVPKVIHAHAILQLGLTNQETQAAPTEESQGASRTLLDGSPQESNQGPGNQFKHMAARYLHPFQLDTSLAYMRLEELTGNAGTSGEHISGWDPDLLKQEISEELTQELNPSPEVVLTLLAQVERALVDWFQHQAPETLKGRLRKEEFQEALELLTDEDRIMFFITLFNLMHEEFVKGSPDYPQHLDHKAPTGLSRTASSASSFSRTTSFRMAAMSTAASLTTATGPSHMQILEKYDLGYKHFNREKQAAKAKAELKKKIEASTPDSSHHHNLPSRTWTASSQADRPKSALKRTVSFNPAGQQLQSHVAIQGATSLAGSFNSHASSGVGTLRRRSSLRFNEAPDLPSAFRPYSSGSHAAGQSRGVGFSAGSQGSVTYAAQARTINEATKRSMHNLHSMRVLNAAIAQAQAGPSLLTKQDNEQLQQTRLYVLQREFAVLYQEARQDRAGMFFTLPVFLVTARLLVHMLFTGVYRLWAKTQNGHNAIQMMDKAIEHLFDPHGYLQRNLSILQSSPQAVSIMAKHPHKSHEAERLHFADVSPLLRAAMADPGSAGARKMLVQGAHNKWAREKAAHKGKQAKPEEYHDPWQGWLSHNTQGPLKTKLTVQQQEELFKFVQDMLQTT